MTSRTSERTANSDRFEPTKVDELPVQPRPSDLHCSDSARPHDDAILVERRQTAFSRVVLCWLFILERNRLDIRVMKTSPGEPSNFALDFFLEAVESGLEHASSLSSLIPRTTEQDPRPDI